jgi:uncharacterized MAPEG superfamily protein
VLHASLFILTNFALSYLIISDRLAKIALGFDDNISPREVVAKYGDSMVKEGKMSARTLARVKRIASAHANSVEHFPFFFGAMVRDAVYLFPQSCCG